MREIIFRAQDYTKAWRYGYVAIGNESAVLFPKLDDGTVMMGVQIYIRPETICQFTGLLDKNGKKIYEGDIVRYWHVDTRCINPDCDLFNWIYESFLKKVEDVVSYENGMFLCEDSNPLIWCGLTNLEELRNDLDVSEEDGWCDCEGNTIDESVLGIEVIGNIHDNPEFI